MVNLREQDALTEKKVRDTINPSIHPQIIQKESEFMAQLIYRFEGVRGRSVEIYDRKCVIATKAGIGSLITGNVSDGEKTIFYTDVVGVQFKKSGALIGYLQFENGSAQMNNQNSNMFSENTFTFENGVNGVTNEQMEAVYHHVCDLIEQVKYGGVTTPAMVAPVQIQQPSSQPAPIAVATTASMEVPAHESAVGKWRCTCGKINADYVSTCSCGVSKHEAKKAASAPAPVPAPAPSAPARTPGNWRCSCGKEHPAYVSTCSCGGNKWDAR